MYPTSLRLSAELRDALKVIAASEHRTLTGLIIHILTEYVENKKED